MASKCIGSVNMPDLSVAIGLGTIPPGTKFAVFQADVQSVRYWTDGTVPTASVGMLLPAGQSVVLSGKLSSFLAVQVTAGAKANVQFLAS